MYSVIHERSAIGADGGLCEHYPIGNFPRPQRRIMLVHTRLNGTGSKPNLEHFGVLRVRILVCIDYGLGIGALWKEVFYHVDCLDHFWDCSYCSYFVIG